MKIIEAMKKIKDLQRKSEDLRRKIGQNSAKLSIEKSSYENPSGKISEWIQAVQDISKEVLRLRIAIQKTNLETMVEIELGDKLVTKCIAEWIHRRRDLALADCYAWKQLTDKGLKPQIVNSGQENETKIEVDLFFSQEEKDEMIERYTAEPHAIDSKLEVVNCVTDIIE
jgi:hypothetical protein